MSKRHIKGGTAIYIATVPASFRPQRLWDVTPEILAPDCIRKIWQCRSPWVLPGHIISPRSRPSSTAALLKPGRS